MLLRVNWIRLIVDDGCLGHDDCMAGHDVGLRSSGGRGMGRSLSQPVQQHADCHQGDHCGRERGMKGKSQLW